MTERELGICARFSSARKQSKLSLPSMARHLGTSVHTLKTYEYGIAPLKFSVGEPFCELTNTNQSWLATGEGVQKPHLPIAAGLKRKMPLSCLFSSAFDRVISPALKEHEALCQRFSYPSGHLFPIILYGLSAGFSVHDLEFELAEVFQRNLSRRWRKKSKAKLLEDVRSIAAMLDFSKEENVTVENLATLITESESARSNSKIQELVMKQLGLSEAQYWKQLASDEKRLEKDRPENIWLH